MGLLDTCRGRRVYLDTNVFIYILEGFAPVSAAVARIAAMLDQGEIQGYTSELALAEALVGPARSGDHRLIDLYSELISTRDGLLVAPVGRELWISAALERAHSALKLPDAVHVVTARAYGCEVLLTNDRGFARASGFDVYFLDDPALC